MVSRLYIEQFFFLFSSWDFFTPKATVEIEEKNFKEIYNGDSWESHAATCIVFNLDGLDVLF